ncbi:MAG: hypothetical protein KAT70_08795, partial [Thermoplasmata archaeon]|nr:hypothetical protein [Thermoplasmata archaeon]
APLTRLGYPRLYVHVGEGSCERNAGAFQRLAILAWRLWFILRVKAKRIATSGIVQQFHAVAILAYRGRKAEMSAECWRNISSSHVRGTSFPDIA